MLVLRIAVPAAVIAWLAKTQDWGQLVGYIRTTDPLLYLLSFVFLCSRNLVGGFRSKILLAHKGQRYSTLALTKYYFIGHFFNHFMPAVVGRDLARGYYFYTTSPRRKEALATILVERFIGTGALMMFTLISIVAASVLGVEAVHGDLLKAILVTFAVLTTVIVLAFHRASVQIVRLLIPAGVYHRFKHVVDFIREVVDYNRSPMILWYTFLNSFAFQFLGIISTWLIGMALGTDTPFLYFLILLPVVWLVSFIPVSINGIGIREGSFVVLFGTVGMPKEMALAISILWFVENLGLGLIGAVLFMLEGRGLAGIRRYRESAADVKSAMSGD